MKQYDVAIVGAGMVGLTAALALADGGMSVLVVEQRQPPDEPGERPDLRVSAINRSAQTLFERLGVWPEIDRRRAASYTAMEVWDKDSFGKIRFDCRQVFQEDLGHIVENRVIQLALLERVRRHAGITLLQPAQCHHLVAGEQGGVLTFAEQLPCSARLIVAADGAESWVRSQLKVPLTSWDYDHHALVATIRTELPHGGIARQIFTSEGPLAFLPLWEPNLCSIVWSLPPQRANELLAADADRFNKLLTIAFDSRLGLCHLESERLAFVLKMRYAHDFAGPGFALIGDAAHTIHPLAGLGVNLGLMDAAALAEVLLAAQRQGDSLADPRVLGRYARWRKAEAVKLIAAMEALKLTFSGRHPAKMLLRDLGLRLVDQLPPLKNAFIEQAMGLSGDLPQLAQPEKN